MGKTLKILIFIFLMNFLTIAFSQEDPTIPIPQRYLNNPLINDSTRNPISYDNPFIDNQKSKKIQSKKLNQNSNIKTEKNNINEPKNKPEESIKKEEVSEEKKEAKKEETKKEETTEKKEEAKADKDYGLFGPIRIGPMIGFGILQGPNISLESKIFRYIGLSISYGGYNKFNVLALPQVKALLNNQSDNFTINSLKMDYRQFEGKFSLFPFGGSFFLGIAYGQRNIKLKSNATVNATIPGLSFKLTTPVSEEVDIVSTYITPQIGWLATWGGRFGWFAVGTELGLQYSLKNTVSLSTAFTDPAAAPYISILATTPEYLAFTEQLKTSLTDNLNKYPLPYWNILKIGWLF